MTDSQVLRKQRFSLVVIFTALLLCAQITASNHSADHYLGHAQELCDNFLSFESIDIPVAANVASLSIIKVVTLLSASSSNIFNSYPARHGLSRAPPSSIL